MHELEQQGHILLAGFFFEPAVQVNAIKIGVLEFFHESCISGTNASTQEKGFFNLC
jgi:hypothetical protein